ncbi:terminase large subunit [Vibrio phage X29]|uniref:terminase large subunit n=1 Tax=Vibrio phage X29 TaxID=1500713 RepID=UPI00051E6491|nr:terminase large subunit [Vibrio phage X29]AIA10287.2 terminase large subunit [Vibrio phage X29]
MRNTVWGDKFTQKLRPKSRISGSDWADKYRYVAPGTSPEPGPWRTSRVPYLKEPMDCSTDGETEVTVMMCSSQIGKSEYVLNIMGYYADQEPAPQLMLQPTVEAAEAFSKERIDPTFRYSSGLKNKLEEGQDGRGSSRKSSTTIRMKHYPGGYLALVGANSPAGLASRPIRIILADEVDRYGFTKEGDPLKLAIQRTTNFHNRKICLVSTPTISGHSKIEEWWLKSDQRYFHVHCPHCGELQVLKWGQVKWRKDPEGKHMPETAYYECASCKSAIKDSDKFDMLTSGTWIKSKPEVKGIAGFHVNSLYSPWVKFSSLVKEWVDIQKSKDKKGLMEFINLKLGEPWEEDDDDFGWDHLHKNRREYYNCEVPEGALLLTAGVDVQHSWIECEVVGWGLGKESWGIEHKKFMGDPKDKKVWEDLDRYLLKQWAYADGSRIELSGACFDSSDGNMMNEVYAFTKPREARRFFSIKGKGGFETPFINKPTKSNIYGAWMFSIGVDTGKRNIFARLRIEDEGAGYCHFPREGDKGYDEEYFKGLLSEKVQFKYVNGQTKTEWKKVYERNEPLDCRNYATASMEILNPNFEYLAEQKGKGVVAKSVQPEVKKKKRRVISKGIS